MNKSRANFRKCAFCPHHNEQAKCCCKKPSKSTNNIKKSKLKSNTLINESSIRYFDDSQLKFQPINISNLMAQNSMLKCQNNNLKNDLMSISHCRQQQKNSCHQYLSVPTSHTLKTQSEQILSDRLYISNKNLQEAILRLDALSRQNKQANEKNTILTSEVQALKFQKEELIQDISILERQTRKMQDKIVQNQKTYMKDGSRLKQEFRIKQDYKVLRQKYENLKFQNSSLSEEIQRLRIQYQRKNHVNSENMSPEWIAETSNKLSFMEHKIQFAENRIKHSDLNKHGQTPGNGYSSQNVQGMKSSPYFQIMHNIKQELALSINTIHSKTRKFTSVFDNVGNVEFMNMTNLICSLIQGFVESCLNLNMTMQKQINRKINVLQKRMDNLLGKLQNFVLQVKNRELRKRSTSRSRVLIGNKSGLNTKSPCIRKIDKENYNNLNSIDKSH